MENQEQLQSAVPPSQPSGYRALFIVALVVALAFIALTAYFWARSMALDDQIFERDGIIASYEAESKSLEESGGDVEERDPSETTYLATQTQNKWDGGLCTYVYEQLKDSELPNDILSGAGLSAVGVADPSIQQVIAPEVVTEAGWTEEYFSRIASQLQQTDERLLSQCDFENRLFIALANESGVLRLLEWVPDELESRSRFAAYQPISGMADMVFSMFSYDAIANPVIWTGYGDAGHLWWKLHTLDDQTFTSDLIESCTDFPIFDEAGNWTDDRVIECDREYLPEAE